jgi:hypothetical protein
VNDDAIHKKVGPALITELKAQSSKKDKSLGHCVIWAIQRKKAQSWRLKA